MKKKTVRKSVRAKKSRVGNRLRAAAAKIRRRNVTKKEVRDLKIDILKNLNERLKNLQSHANMLEMKVRNLKEESFVWNCADGRELHPSEMDERHLQNTICYLQRRISHQFGHATWLGGLEYQVRALYEMLKEARRRGLQV